MSRGLRLDEIVAALGGVLEGDGSVLVSQVASLLSAGEGRIAFLASSRYRQQLKTTRATAVIVPPQFSQETSLPRIVHPNAYAYYARVVALLNPARQRRRGVHSGAVVKSELPASVSVGENAVIGERVRIGVAEGALGRSALLAYGFPLLALFAGALAGSALGGEAGSIGGALAGLIVGWLGLRRAQRRRQHDPRFRPSIRP